MRKWLLVLCAVMGLAFAGSAFALSESDYRELLKGSEFSAADGELKQAWNEAKARLTPEEFDALKASQREWVKSVRDEAAEELIDFQGYSRVMAYTAVTNDRVKAIRALGAKKAESVSLKPGIINSDKDYITVIAEGRGKDRQAALESAYTDAVRLAVGMIISGRTELNNDELSESIIMHSRGVIENFDLLDEKEDGRQTRLYIRAKVHREILQNETKRYIEAQTVKADTSGVIKAQMDDHAKTATTRAKQRTGAELLREVLENYGPEDFFSASLNPKVLYDKQTKKPHVQITEKFNQPVFWDEFLPKLRNALDGVKEGCLLGGGIMTLDWHKVPYSISLRDYVDSSYPSEVFEHEDNEWRKHWKVVIPNNNASFTVYDIPITRNALIEVILEALFNEDQFYQDQLSWYMGTFEGASKDFISMWIDFLKKMSLKVTYSVSYLNKDGDVISVQVIRTGRREFCVYRSAFYGSGQPLVIGGGLCFAPGYVGGKSKYEHLFLGTGNFNQKYGAGYVVELDPDELQRLDTMKFEVVFEQ